MYLNKKNLKKKNDTSFYCLYMPEVDLAVESYAKLQKVDPFRLDNMDTYSNLLYVKVRIIIL